ASDRVGELLREPEVAVSARGDEGGEVAAVLGGELRHGAVHGDASDLIDVLFREPQGAIRPCGDPPGLTVVRWNRILGEQVAARAELGDQVGVALGEPEVAVGANRDAVWAAPGADLVLGDLAGRRDLA